MLMRIRPKQFVFPRNYKLKKLKEAFLFYSRLTFVVYFSPVLFPFQLEKFCLLGAVHTWRPYILLESIYTPRLEICQKIYMTKFSDQKFYTLKVRTLRLFLLKKKQRKCINWVAFLLKFNWVCKIFTVSVQNHTWCV